MTEPIMIDLKTMRDRADDASELMKSLANPHRLLLLCKLAEGESSVGSLARFLDIRDATTSQHLARLRRDGIIVGRRDGRIITYRIENQAIRDIIKALHHHYGLSAH